MRIYLGPSMNRRKFLLKYLYQSGAEDKCLTLLCSKTDVLKLSSYQLFENFTPVCCPATKNLLHSSQCHVETCTNTSPVFSYAKSAPARGAPQTAVIYLSSYLVSDASLQLLPYP